MKVLFWIRSILLKPPFRSAVIKATCDDQSATESRSYVEFRNGEK